MFRARFFTLLAPAAFAAGVVLAEPVSAQQTPGAGSAPGTDCPSAPPTQPATPPARGGGSGTAPGGMGSTGWSGGTGGSHIGTAPAGPTPGSPDPHPQTAQGLDPTRPSQQPPRAPCRG